MKIRNVTMALIAAATFTAIGTDAWARDLEYQGSEVSVRVNPGEPTQIQFPGEIAGGFKKKLSVLSLDKKGDDLIVFASEGIAEAGEAIIVRLTDGRSFSVRVQRATNDKPRDDVVRISDPHGSLIASSTEEDPPYKEKAFDYAPPSQVSGLMREAILVTEFGKGAVAGYRMSDKYRGETVLDDGTLQAQIDRIMIGSNLWVYVLDVSNKLDEGQRLNPATFRMDGTRAISIQNPELAPRPLTIEQQLAGKHNTKVYVVTRPKKLN